MFEGARVKKLLGVVAFLVFLLVAGGVMAFFAEREPDVARVVWRLIIGGGVLLLFMVWDLWSGNGSAEEA